jgi:hypothetical protein
MKGAPVSFLRGRAGCSFIVTRLLLATLLAVLASCGGGGGGGSGGPNTPVAGLAMGANVLAVTVDTGTDGRSINSPYASVTICVPGTTTCQTVSHVLVDTGSYGLRLASSAVSATLAAALPAVTTPGGVSIAECAHFATGFAWGPVRRADVKLAGQTAARLPIQIVSDPAHADAPASCSNTGADFGATLGANGILGVGLFNQDCPLCAQSTSPGAYFACTGASCSGAVVPLSSQVANPVPAFAENNNGVALVMPEVPPGGVATLAGSLIFGIGTQANNQLGSATVFATNSQGNFTTRYNGTDYTASFLDSGSNGIFFTDPAIPKCSDFYCPPAPLTLSAVNTSATGVSGSVTFKIESIQSISANVAAAHVGGDIGLAGIFDWGLPFFFGRTVFVAIEGAPTAKGPGPYWAY